MERIYGMPFASVYPLYIAKVERKGRTKADVDEVTRWLTGYTQDEIDAHVAAGTTFRDFFADASLHPGATLITGVICGVTSSFRLALRKAIDVAPLEVATW